MKGSTIAVIGGIALVILLVSRSPANANPVDLSGLVGTYGADKVQRLQNLESALAAQGLTNWQIKYALAQSLFETGLFTGVWNQNATDNLNNWAGISNSDGSLKSYPDVQSFVAEYIPLLQKGTDPIDAPTLAEFSQRLAANGYYAEDPSVYLNGLTQYYNLLS